MTRLAIQPQISSGPASVVINDAAKTSGDPTLKSVVTMDISQRGPWETFLKNSPSATIFHTLAWHDAVRDTFGHDPLYLMAYSGDRLEGILPLFQVRSILVGTMLVSVPYAVYGGPITTSQDACDRLVHRAKDLAQEMNAKVIDFRTQQACHSSLTDVDRYVTFQKVLPDRVEDVLAGLPRKARAAARKSRDRSGLTVAFGDEHLRTVWDLYCKSMRRLGSLNYPFAFFEGLIHETPNQHVVSIVQSQGKPVAGLITFLFRDTVLPYFSGSDRRYDQLCPNNLLYLSLMEYGVERGYRFFDFGRSRRDNPGAYNFKKWHGFEPKPLGYQCFVPFGKSAPNLTPSHKMFNWPRRIWPRLPLGVTKAAGAWLSKSIPG
jgi:FemAB-related protein (PEP-CTERM system-associated)